MSKLDSRKKRDLKKSLIEETESQLVDQKSSVNKRKQKLKQALKIRDLKQFSSPNKISKFIKEDQITLTEQSNILKEYETELKFLGIKRKSNDISNNDIKIEKKTNKNPNNKNNLIFSDNAKIKVPLISDALKIYNNLFEYNSFDNNKPHKLVDYVIRGNPDNELSVQKIYAEKISYEDIKRNILIKNQNYSSIEDLLLNKSLYEYLKCDFTNSNMKELLEKINNILMEQYSSQNTDKIEDKKTNYTFLEKKDKFTYSNSLTDKLKAKNLKSFIDFTNDADYIKSLFYISNKYNKYNNKFESMEKNLLEILKINMEIINKFDSEDKKCSIQCDENYFSLLTKNGILKKFMCKKFKYFNNKILNNTLINTLTKDNFNAILEILVNNKNDDVRKLYKLTTNILCKDNNKKLKKSEIKNFVIILRFLFDLILLKSKQSNEILNNKLSVVNLLFNYLEKNEIITLEGSNNKLILKRNKNNTKNKLNIKKNKEISNFNNNIMNLSENEKLLNKSNIGSCISDSNNKKRKNKIRIPINNFSDKKLSSKNNKSKETFSLNSKNDLKRKFNINKHNGSIINGNIIDNNENNDINNNETLSSDVNNNQKISTFKNVNIINNNGVKKIKTKFFINLYDEYNNCNSKDNSNNNKKKKEINNVIITNGSINYSAVKKKQKKNKKDKCEINKIVLEKLITGEDIFILHNSKLKNSSDNKEGKEVSIDSDKSNDKRKTKKNNICVVENESQNIGIKISGSTSSGTSA